MVDQKQKVDAGTVTLAPGSIPSPLPVAGTSGAGDPVEVVSLAANPLRVCGIAGAADPVLIEGPGAYGGLIVHQGNPSGSAGWNIQGQVGSGLTPVRVCGEGGTNDPVIIEGKAGAVAVGVQGVSLGINVNTLERRTCTPPLGNETTGNAGAGAPLFSWTQADSATWAAATYPGGPPSVAFKLDRGVGWGQNLGPIGALITNGMAIGAANPQLEIRLVIRLNTADSLPLLYAPMIGGPVLAGETKLRYFGNLRLISDDTDGFFPFSPESVFIPDCSKIGFQARIANAVTGAASATCSFYLLSNIIGRLTRSPSWTA